MIFASRRRVDKDAADRLYTACAKAARRPALFIGFGVPDTLQGRFEMIALHLFPVLYRLMHVPGDDPELARLVSESFVNDMDDAFREMGVGDLSVPKHMTKLYRSFGGRISAYKQALEVDDAALAEALSRNIFPDPAQGGPAQDGSGGGGGGALALAQHLKASVAAVQAASLAQLRAGEVPFPEPSTG